jgi:sigma-E factor negative regulatory protein RseA
MTEEIREQLSALVDDELDEVERPLLLGRLQRDAELRDCLGRYQLIGEVMRGAGQVATLGVAERVRKVLEQETGPAAGKSSRVDRNWWKPLAGFAVAASVALVAILTVTSISEESADETVQLAGKQTPAAEIPVSEQQWDRIEPQVDKRMAGYLVNHNEYAASRGVQGVMPYVRIVGYSNDQ